MKPCGVQPRFHNETPFHDAASGHGAATDMNRTGDPAVGIRGADSSILS
jgi:hypothetical protein